MMKELNSHQKELIRKASVTPDDVLKNLDALNEEIEETYNDLVVKESTKPKKVETQMQDEKDLNLEKELAMLKAKIEVQEERKAKEAEAKKTAQSKEIPEEQLSPEEQQRQAIMSVLLNKTELTEAHIENFKQKYGKNGVNAIAFGEEDIYLFTYLRRGQFEKITELVQAAAKSDLQANADKLLKEKVVQYCVLWPKASSIEFLTNSRAGIIDTLYQTIMLNSYFLSPQQAMMLTTQL